jgi:hypothetical protein
MQNWKLKMRRNGTSRAISLALGSLVFRTVCTLGRTALNTEASIGLKTQLDIQI